MMTHVWKRDCPYCGHVFEWDDWKDHPTKCKCGAILVTGAWWKDGRKWSEEDYQ